MSNDELKSIKAIDCKFAIHVPTRSSDIPDIHLIKELIEYTDGSFGSNLRIVKDFKRPFWITKAEDQDHKNKKEWESKDKLIEYSVTQSELKFKVAKALGKQWSKDSLKQLSQSPYLYGSDITSTALLKRQYQTKYPEANYKSSVAVYDIETDVIYGTGSIIVATIVFQNKIFTVATEFFMQGYSTPNYYVDIAFNKYLGEYKEKLNLEYEFSVVKTPADAVKAIFKKAHEWGPDFIAIWNMDFDIPRTIKAIEDAGYDPKDVFSDPKIPKPFRRCEYKEGKKKKVTASGKVTPIVPSSQWHTLYCTSSFYVIDAMCVYKRIRTPPAQEEPSYSLDAILKKELNITKLKFVEADAYTGLKWHEFMQSKFKAEYIVYNMFDCLAMLELDTKTKDLSHTFSSYAGITDFDKFTSNPRRIHDELDGFCQSKGLVLSSSGSAPQVDVAEIIEDAEEDDVLESLSLKGWINKNRFYSNLASI